MSNKMFGTDGVRGKANVYPMTAEVALKIGMAAAVYLGDVPSKTNRVIIGKDTRISCYMLETALTAGLASMGKHVFLLGPMPTPAVSMLTKSTRSDLGIMISASHNPYYDNGIKLFDNNGNKLLDADEQAIAELINSDLTKYMVKSDKIGRVERLRESIGRYIEHVKSAFPTGMNLKNLKIVVDCANGAAYKIAPTTLYELGADVISIGIEPNGFNINDKVGSTHLEALRDKVLNEGADIGLALDGDADRLIMIDEKGDVINGDRILAAIALEFKANNKLNNNSVVSTVMANMALEDYLNSQGINLLRSNVGDRYVSDLMKENGLNLGGEQSGHIIMSDNSNTGDGLLCALVILGIIKKAGKPASSVLNLFKDKPQIIKNYKYTGTNPLDNKSIVSYIEELKTQHKHTRILVRKSGTESLVRVMIEGDSEQEINDISNLIIDYMNSAK